MPIVHKIEQKHEKENIDNNSLGSSVGSIINTNNNSIFGVDKSLKFENRANTA